MSTIHSPFSSWHIESNFSSILFVFHQFFTWFSVGHVDLYFFITLVRKANAVEEETTWAA
jgi:uncharacterized membrane protein SpoIIM required for sporulation